MLRIVIDWMNYEEFRDKYKRTIVVKRFVDNQKKMDRANGDMKGTWRVLNSILHGDRGDILFIESEGVQIDSEAEMASRFNEFFVQSISRLNVEIPPVTFECHRVNHQNTKFTFKAVSIAEVKSSVRELKNGFNMNKMVFGDVIDKMGIFVADIINGSLSAGIFSGYTEAVYGYTDTEGARDD